MKVTRSLTLFLAISIFSAISIFGSSTFALTKQEQLRALHTIVDELKSHYGMPRFKEKHYGKTLDSIEAKYADLIENAMTLEEKQGFTPVTKREALSRFEFQQLMVGLAAECRDGHTNIYRGEFGASTIGIRTAAVGGKLFIAGFMPDFYIDGRASKKLKVGDEIVEIDGQSVQELAKQNILYAQTATYQARNIFALESLLHRDHRFLRPQKEGTTVKVKFRRPGEKTEIEGIFHWVYTKELLQLPNLYPKYFQSSLQNVPYYFGAMNTTDSFFLKGLRAQKPRTGDILDVGLIINAEIEEQRRKRLAAKAESKSPVPDEPSKEERQMVDAEGPEEATKPEARAEAGGVKRLTALSFKHEGKTYGYIRIPSYSPPSFGAVETELAWLKKVISYMENQTDALILDQVSNGGGYVYYVSELARFFAHKKTLKGMRANTKLSETYVRSTDPGRGGFYDPRDLPVFAQNRLSILEHEKLKVLWQSGEQWSGMLPFFSSFENGASEGIGLIVSGDYPTYSKEVILVNDSRSASGGDFFPAILQHNKSALLVGEASRGLGGAVYRGQSSISAAEMEMRCTFNECEFDDNSFIENRGAVPDIYRPVKPADLRDDFKAYAGDILQIADLRLQGKTNEEIQDSLRKRIKKADEEKDTGDKTEESSNDGVEKAAKIQREILQKELDQLVSGQAQIATDIAEGYSRLSDLIKKIPETERKVVLRGLVVKLPKILIQDDPYLLGSLFEKAEVLDRLKDLEALPRIKENPGLLKLVSAVAEFINLVPRISPPNFCRLQLSKG